MAINSSGFELSNCAMSPYVANFTNRTVLESGFLYQENSSKFCNVSKDSDSILDIRKDVYPIMMPQASCNTIIVLTFQSSTNTSEDKDLIKMVILAFCLASLLLSSSIACCTPFVKRPISPTIRLSLSLSAANTAFAAVVFIGTVVHSYLPYVFEIVLPTCIMLAVEALRLGVILVQVYHLLAVAIIHYLGTLKPLHYASILTPRCTKILVVCLWLFPILGMFIGFSSIPNQGFQSERCANNHFRHDGMMFRYVWTLFYFGPTVMLVIVYLHIFFILRRRGRDLMKSIEYRRKMSRNLKTVKTTALIVVTFLIGWSPNVLAFLLICKECPFQIHDMRISMAIFSSCYILFILKVFIDTFIYAIRLPEIREALKNLYHYITHGCVTSADAQRHLLSMSSTRISNVRSVNSVISIRRKSPKHKAPVKYSVNSCSGVEIRPLFEEAITVISNGNGIDQETRH